MLREGTKAPDFELRGVHEGTIGTYRLGEYTEAGNWALLTFYAFDFNPICTEGMCSLRDTEYFGFEDGLVLLGVSGDGVYAHDRFGEEHRINYPLLADTSKDVGRDYDVLVEEHDGMEQVHRRALYLVDDERTIRLALAVDADEPEDIDLAPAVETVRKIRG